MARKSDRKPEQPKPTGNNARRRTMKGRDHPNGMINRNAQVYSTLTDGQRDAVQRIIDGADPNVAAIYLEHEDRLRLIDGNHSGTAHYSHFEGGVYLDAGKTLDGGEGRTWFHEFGHQIDYTTRRSGDGEVIFSARVQSFRDAIEHDVKSFIASDAVKDRAFDAFEKTIARRREIDEMWNTHRTSPELVAADRRGDLVHFKLGGYINERSRKKIAAMDLGSMSRDEFESIVRQNFSPNTGVRQKAAEKILREGLGTDAGGNAGVSDIFDGQTKGAVNAGWGHKNSYWRNRDNVAIEAYADMSAAAMMGGTYVENMQKYLPTAYNEFQSLVTAKRGA